jgi:hypothetical protein
MHKYGNGARLMCSEIFQAPQSTHSSAKVLIESESPVNFAICWTDNFVFIRGIYNLERAPGQEGGKLFPKLREKSVEDATNVFPQVW